MGRQADHLPQSRRAGLIARTGVLGVLLVSLTLAGAEIAPVRIVGYNTYNFQSLDKPQVKSPESRQMVASILASLNPDMAVLIEIGGKAGLDELVGLLATAGVRYPFASVVEGEDPERRIGIISKLTPVKVQHETLLTYNLYGKAVLVQRGFAHLLYTWDNGYTLHLLGAHLKSKMFDARGQTDMRRYEARELRYLVNRILKAEPDANVLAVGDFNDTPDSSPINTLCDRRAKLPLQLFDLRPTDKYGLAWTHLWEEADTYSRIDYGFASYGLLPEIDMEKTYIPLIPDWGIASDHRPVVITLTPQDRPLDDDLLQRFTRNMRRPEVPASQFHDGPVVGTRKARKPSPGK